MQRLVSFSKSVCASVARKHNDLIDGHGVAAVVTIYLLLAVAAIGVYDMRRARVLDAQVTQLQAENTYLARSIRAELGTVIARQDQDRQLINELYDDRPVKAKVKSSTGDTALTSTGNDRHWYHLWLK